LKVIKKGRGERETTLGIRKKNSKGEELPLGNSGVIALTPPSGKEKRERTLRQGD